jgi:hypothetical protein
MTAPNDEMKEIASAQTPSTKQQIFLRYFTAIMIDLTVLNLFAECCRGVHCRGAGDSGCRRADSASLSRPELARQSPNANNHLRAVT